MANPSFVGIPPLIPPGARAEGKSFQKPVEGEEKLGLMVRRMVAAAMTAGEKLDIRELRRARRRRDSTLVLSTLS